MAIKFLSSGNVTGGLTLSGALSGTSATFTGDITARVGNFKSPDASESIIMNLAANNGNNAATFRTTASGSIFEIRSQNSGTIKIDSPTTTFTGNVIIDGAATIGGSDVITRSGTTAQGRLAIWQNDSAIKGDNNLFYASQYLTIGVGTAGGFAALRINAATTAETYLDFTEGATFTKRAQIQVDTNDNMYFRNTSNNTLALTIDSLQNVQVDGSNVTVINASDPQFTVSDDDTNYRGSMRWLTSSNVLEFFTRYAGTYYTNNLVLDRGNVGIGGLPSVSFEIAKAGARMKMIDGTNQLNMGLWDGANYRFEGDANRPMFFTSYQGNIKFGISGGTTMTVQSGGVGIGTTSPDSLLVVQADAHNEAFAGKRSATEYLWFLRNENNSGRFQLYNSSSNHTIEMTGANGRITAAQGIFGSAFALTSNGYATFGSTSSSVPIAFAIDGDGSSPEMFIKTDGNVGIGTTGPPSKLTVMESTLCTNSGTDGGTSYVPAKPILLVTTDGNGTPSSFYGTNSVFTVGIGGGITGGVTTKHLSVLLNGKVNIGTGTTVTGFLNIEKTGNHLHLRNSGAASGKYWNFDVASNNRLYILNNGDTGVYIADGATSWTANSDESLKENIKPLKNVLDKIKDYRCVEYNLKANKDKKIGFIAQDWENDFAPIISKDDKGLLGMKYTETIPVLLKAIQELKAEIELLKKK